MSEITKQITELKEVMVEFDAQYEKYSTENVKSAGNKARKALLLAKKKINVLRKDMLAEQKEKKVAARAEKAKKAAAKTGKVGKVGKKGHADEAAAPVEE